MANAKSEDTTGTIEDDHKTSGDDVTTTSGRSTSLAETSGRGLATVDFGDDAGKGIDDVTADEFVVPFLVVLQSNSPQCEEVREGGLPGARPGMLFNTATQQLYDGEVGVCVVPVVRDHTYPEFTPRNLGGGFVGTHAPDDPLVLRLRAEQGAFGRLFTSDKKTPDGAPAEGTELQETYALYVLFGPDLAGGELPQRAIINFKSTQIKKYKGFVSRVDGVRYRAPDGSMVQPPLWAHRWRVTTVAESNKKGKFYGVVIRLDGRAEDGSELPTINSLIKRTDPLYVAGREFHDLVKDGRVRADYAGEEKAQARADEDEIPM